MKRILYKSFILIIFFTIFNCSSSNVKGWQVEAIRESPTHKVNLKLLAKLQNIVFEVTHISAWSGFRGPHNCMPYKLSLQKIPYDQICNLISDKYKIKTNTDRIRNSPIINTTEKNPIFEKNVPDNEDGAKIRIMVYTVGAYRSQHYGTFIRSTLVGLNIYYRIEVYFKEDPIIIHSDKLSEHIRTLSHGEILNDVDKIVQVFQRAL